LAVLRMQEMSFKTKTLSVVALGSLALISLVAITASAMPATTTGTDQAVAAAGGSGDCDQSTDMTRAQDRDMDRDGICDVCDEVNCHDYLYESPGPHSQ